MERRVLISGAFGDANARFGFYERIAEALEARGWQVHRFNAFESLRRPVRGFAKAGERLFTLPGRWLGIPKERIRAALPWTMTGRREHGLVAAVESFRPAVLIVIASLRFQPETLARCRALGVRELVGWYVEGPVEPGVPERESTLYDRYYCIHREIHPEARGRIGWLPAHALDRASFHRLRTPRAPVERIVFVGAASRRRIRYLGALLSLPLELWGEGWSKLPAFAPFHRGRFIWGEAVNRLYNERAIVLNIATWDAASSGLTQRVVDVPASGAFLLTDDTAELRQLYVVPDEVATFTTPEALRAKCEYYLTHQAERETIADRGHQHALTLADYSATARVLMGMDSGDHE